MVETLHDNDIDGDQPLIEPAPFASFEGLSNCMEMPVGFRNHTRLLSRM
jgi:hypothetical protein